MKSGYQTTEFWVSVGTALAALTDEGGKHQEMLMIVAGVLCAMYIVSRTIIKWKEIK
jgi:hypothetical protein